MTKSAKSAAKKLDLRPWEPGGKIKIIFPDAIIGGEWWRIYNPKNEMTVLAQDPIEARQILDALNERDILIKALERAERLFNEALPKFDWGKSALDANAIALLNEVPIEVKRALSTARGAAEGVA